MKILSRSFFNRPTLRVAQDLLGCFLVRRFFNVGTGHRPVPTDVIKKYKIVETESYNGPKDRASHASRGRTARNAVMFGRPGLIYVYFTYGMHYMLNIVTGRKGFPAAILIRAVEPNLIENYELRIMNNGTNGPAKLTKVLKINKTFNGLLIYTKKHGLWIESRDQELKKSQIVRAKRVGVDYAGRYKDKLWRFYIKDNKFISGKK